MKHTLKGWLVDNAVTVDNKEDTGLREETIEHTVKLYHRVLSDLILIGGEDVATRATDGMATAGRNYTLNGRLIKVVGEHESVGITLTDAFGKVGDRVLAHETRHFSKTKYFRFYRKLY